MIKWGMAASLLIFPVADLSSESVTLTTYYPAPSGVYTRMITTGNTYLSRDTNETMIGTLTPSGTPMAHEKLLVNGDIRLNGPSGDASGPPSKGFKIGNVGLPTDLDDVITVRYLQNSGGSSGAYVTLVKTRVGSVASNPVAPDICVVQVCPAIYPPASCAGVSGNAPMAVWNDGAIAFTEQPGNVRIVYCNCTTSALCRYP